MTILPSLPSSATAPVQLPQPAGPATSLPTTTTPAAPARPVDRLPYTRNDQSTIGASQGQALTSISLTSNVPTWSASTKAQIRHGFQQGLKQYGISPQEITQLLKQFGISNLEITEASIQDPANTTEIDFIQRELGKRLNNPELQRFKQGLAVPHDGQFGKGSVQAMAALRDAMRGEPIELKVTPIRQQTQTGCYRTAETMMYNVIHGKDGTDEAYTEFDTRERISAGDRPAVEQYIARSENASGRITVNRDQAMLALDTIDEELEAGRPVTAGVSYRKQDGKEYNEGITDHFVLITGRGYDESGTYYTFQDPAGGKTNKLRLDPATGRLSGKGDMVGVYDVTLIHKAGDTSPETVKRYQQMGKVVYSQGQRSSGIQDMQQMLTAMGYDTKGSNGDYGPGTATALRNFQQAHNLPVAGGKVDSKALKQIQTTFREHQATNPDKVMFKRGQNTPQIANLQKVLTRLGYGTNGSTGSFGPGTEAAVKKFQAAQGWPQTGTIDNRTWLKILELGGQQ